MLENIWKRQYAFETAFFNPRKLTKKERIKWTKEFILCAHQELAEVMNSIDWKTYHAYGKKKYSEQETREEIIDVLKFVLNLCIVWKMTPEVIYEEFQKKSDLTEKRLKKKAWK